MRTILVLTAAALLAGLGSHAHAEMIYTAPPNVVAAHAELVVRARVDLESRRATILEVYRGDLEGTIEVENLRDFTSGKGLGDARSPSPEAVLFLDELDGRYYLVHTSSPAWILPHAAILYLTADGEVVEYGQLVSGVLHLTARKGSTLATLEADLVAWLNEPRAVRLDRPSLPVSDAKRLHDVIDPFVDLHRRAVVAEPQSGQLAAMLDGLQTLAVESDGELQRRSIEAMLVLAEQRGPEQKRREATEARLVTLLDRLGAKPFVEPCLDEIRSPAVSASRRTAAKLLRRIGGQPKQRARETLLGLLASDRSTLGTEAYYALRDLGYAAQAEEALRTPPSEER